MSAKPLVKDIKNLYKLNLLDKLVIIFFTKNIYILYFKFIKCLNIGYS